jgi:glycosyltransferase involved in cell wall biosynthesis
MSDRPDLTIVAPMFNEEANVASTIDRIKEAMKRFRGTWEFVMVNDGSTDNTEPVARSLTAKEPNVRVTGYPQNAGRGRALRWGFAEARGRIVASVDFDLSYSPDHILRMYDYLAANPGVDIVLASAYMPGGKAKGVPAGRLVASYLGNVVLRFALGGIHTSTCVVRAYRREVLEALDLESDGKEIHLEILSKALALGFRIAEIPATLTGRKKGKSKFRLKKTSLSHLLFSIVERPMMLFGALGLLLILLGLVDGVYIIYKWRTETLNPSRPLMTLLVILLVGGVQILAFGFLAMLAGMLRRMLVRLESRVRLLAREVEELRARKP